MLRLTATRIGYGTVGVAALALTFGFAFGAPAVTWLWPWPDGPLSYLFVASILAAFGVGGLLVALTRDWRAAAGGGIALLAGFGAMAAALALRGATGHALGFAAVAAAGAAMLHWALRETARDARGLPPVVRASFVVFSLALLSAGVALVFGAPHIFPWPLKPETSLLYGFMFLGLFLNYLYVALRGTWSDVKVSLLGFLAYDLVLIGPFLKHFARVPADHRLSLVIYTAVLVYSGALAIAYLVLSPRWRLGAASAAG